MKYEKYTVLDFVRNEDFQDWVKKPDDKSDFYWKSWMQNHKNKKHLVMQAREILTSISFPTEKASQSVMDDVFEKVLKSERPLSLQKIEAQKINYSVNIKKTFAIAASLLLIAAFGFILFNFTKNLPEPDKTTLFKETIKENPAGRKSTFHLTDGSVIKLNASSTLRVANNFGIEKREVYLEGEAFFEISKNPQKPFIVHTGDISTIVTGTAFNVNAYGKNNSVIVAVYEGKVNAILHQEGRSDTLALQKSDMAIFDKSVSKLSKTTFDYLETMGWKDGIIYFKNTNSTDAFQYLERWYGVDINIESQDKILGSFYGEFKNENLENVLSAMSKALRFEYQFNDGNVFVKPINIEYE